MPLSDRIRPNTEAAPWVVAEVRLLESFYELVVKERDLERRRNDLLTEEVAKLKAENERLQKAHDHQANMAGLMMREAERAEEERAHMEKDLAKLKRLI
jgi:hypothetical protein